MCVCFQFSPRPPSSKLCSMYRPAVTRHTRWGETHTHADTHTHTIHYWAHTHHTLTHLLHAHTYSLSRTSLRLLYPFHLPAYQVQRPVLIGWGVRGGVIQTSEIASQGACHVATVTQGGGPACQQRGGERLQHCLRTSLPVYIKLFSCSFPDWCIDLDQCMDPFMDLLININIVWGINRQLHGFM